MQTHVEIGPSNASPGQHRRNDATEQMQNPTLARIQHRSPDLKSADALTTKPRVPVAKPDFFSYELSDLKRTPLPSLHVDFSLHGC